MTPQRIVRSGRLAALALLATACSGLERQQDVAARVDRIEAERLRAHVLALEAIGPRPVSDVEATRATVALLARELAALGYDVREESVGLQLQDELVARVRPADEPQAEPIERLFPGDLAQGGAPAMAALSQRLAAEGWTVDGYALRRMAEPRQVSVPNLIATQRGLAEPGEAVELCAHYDTVVFSPGADDNSSGVAALLEVARVLAGAPTRRTLRFCFFGAEEVGLAGSAAHVEALRADEQTRVVAALHLDSVGFRATEPGSQGAPEDVPWFLSVPDRGDFVLVAGNWSSGWVGNEFEAAIEAYAPELACYSLNRLAAWLKDAGRGDTANYWRAGLPSIVLSDTGNFRNATYHRPDDTADTLDYVFLEAVTRATAATALHLAEPYPEATGAGR